MVGIPNAPTLRLANALSLQQRPLPSNGSIPPPAPRKMLPGAYTRMAPPAVAFGSCQLHHTSRPVIRVPRAAATTHPPPPARAPEVARASARKAPTADAGSAQVACTSARPALTWRTQLPTPNGAPLPFAHAHTVYGAASACGAGVAATSMGDSAVARQATRTAVDRAFVGLSSEALRGAARRPRTPDIWASFRAVVSVRRDWGRMLPARLRLDAGAEASRGESGVVGEGSVVLFGVAGMASPFGDVGVSLAPRSGSAESRAGARRGVMSGLVAPHSCLTPQGLRPALESRWRLDVRTPQVRSAGGHPLRWHDIALRGRTRHAPPPEGGR